MKLKAKSLDISTGGTLVVIINKKDAERMDIHPMDRLLLCKGKSCSETVLADITSNSQYIPPGTIGCMEEVTKSLEMRAGTKLSIAPTSKPLSLEFIRNKLDGDKLKKKEIEQIVSDIVANKLNDIELTYFVSACYSNSMSSDETTYLTKAMANHGDILKMNAYPIMDKHCVGGVAGNRTTMLVVPIVASAGLTIPKTSSRSITSPAGTADTMEALTNVCVPLKDMKRIVSKIKGCIVWGGALNLAPADDKIIRVEKPLGIDAKSQLLASIMAKKLSVSSTHLLIDIPVGKGAKVESMRYAKKLQSDFQSLSKKIGIKAKVIITDGSQPIGNGIGPLLEARDVLWILQNDYRAPLDLRDKSVMMAGYMLEMGGKAKPGHGQRMAFRILESGMAYQKFIEIIKEQGGKETDPDELLLAEKVYEVMSRKSGTIHHIDNRNISKIARIAGAPQDDKAGIYLHKHVGDHVKRGEVLFTIYAHNRNKLQFAIDAWDRIGGFVVN
jgi:AMP phosphorylase